MPHSTRSKSKASQRGGRPATVADVRQSVSAADAARRATGSARQSAAATSGVDDGPRPIEDMDNFADVYEVFAERFPDMEPADLRPMVQAQLEHNAKLRTLQVDALTRDKLALPRDASFQLNSMPKLNRNNFHTWVVDVDSFMEAVPAARNILFGFVVEGDEGYDAAIDARLVGTIRGICDRESTNNVCYIIDSERFTSGATLLQRLEEELTRNDSVIAANILRDLNKVTMYNNDVDAVIREIDALATRGWQVNEVITDKQKVVALDKATGTSAAYWETWSTLELDQGKSADWFTVCNALRARRKRLNDVKFQRGPRGIALAANEQRPEPKAPTKKTIAASPSKPGPSPPLARSQAYWIGKRDPNNPDRPAACWTCGETGHIQRQCPQAESQLATTSKNKALAAQENKIQEILDDESSASTLH